MVVLAGLKELHNKRVWGKYPLDLRVVAGIGV